MSSQSAQYSDPASAGSDSTQSKDYFDLHISGLGYVNRIREVHPSKGKRGDPFLACSIAALSGPKSDVSYRYFDVRVTGSDAEHLIRRCQAACEDERKILIGFRLGDPWIDTFTYKAGPKKGETGYAWKARLLSVRWIRIDGEEIYKAPPRTNSGNEQPPAPADDSSDPLQDKAAA